MCSGYGRMVFHWDKIAVKCYYFRPGKNLRSWGKLGEYKISENYWLFFFFQLFLFCQTSILTRMKFWDIFMHSIFFVTRVRLSSWSERNSFFFPAENWVGKQCWCMINFVSSGDPTLDPTPEEQDPLKQGGSLFREVSNVLDSDRVISVFELHKCYYVHFGANILVKDIESSNLLRYCGPVGCG